MVNFRDIGMVAGTECECSCSAMGVVEVQSSEVGPQGISFHCDMRGGARRGTATLAPLTRDLHESAHTLHPGSARLLAPPSLRHSSTNNHINITPPLAPFFGLFLTLSVPPAPTFRHIPESSMTYPYDAHLQRTLSHSDVILFVSVPEHSPNVHI